MRLKLILFSICAGAFSHSFGQIKFEDVKIDTSITGFHFAIDYQGTKVFTKNGPSDIQIRNPTAFSVTVAPNFTSAMAKAQLSQLLNMSKLNGYKISNLIEKDTLINGNSSYYISYIETDEKNKYKNAVFNAFISKDNSIVLFTGGDLDNGTYIDKFKQTFYSIKL